MTEFKVGDKVRVNEGELEGAVGTVAGSVDDPNRAHVTLVTFELMNGEGSLLLYTETLVKADEDHPALSSLKLHPELVNGDHLWRVTTTVDGLMYQSLTFGSEIIGMVLRKPPAGLFAVEYFSAKEPTKNWKALWTE